VIFQFIFKYVFTYAFFNKINAFFKNIKIIQTFIYLFNPYLSSYTGQIGTFLGTVLKQQRQKILCNWGICLQKTYMQ